MNIRNINLFKARPIVVNITETESIVVEKIPGMATAFLYDNEVLFNLVDKYLNETRDPKTNGLLILRDIIQSVLKEKETVNQIIHYTIGKDNDWIDKNMNEIQKFQLLVAIMTVSIEETAIFVKKNNLNMEMENQNQ
jgi:hypothetical protein